MSELLPEVRDHGSGHNNMMDTNPTESGFSYDSEHGGMMPNREDPDDAEHCIWVDGKLFRTYWGKDVAMRMAHELHRKYPHRHIEVKPKFQAEQHDSMRMTNNTIDDSEARENDEGGSVSGKVVSNFMEKTSPKLCRSPKRLGRSDHSSCVAQGLRPHQSKGKGHTDGNGHYLKGHKAKSVKYGGNVKDYS